MSALSVTYAILFYVATTVLIVGLVYKIRLYAKTPAPLKIPTTPAPVTQTGVVFRMAREVVLFSSLFKSNKWIWIFGWMFHFALLLVLLRHFRYFVDTSSPIWFWVPLIQPFGMYAAFAMLAGLGGLWARRILVDRVRYISGPSDHLMLALLVAIGASGAMMKFVEHTDIVAVKGFFQGLLTFSIQPLPGDPVLLIHLALVAVLMLIFPISKLLHAPGIFFSPTRNQVDNPREKRHQAQWTVELEADGGNK
ncbi:MAG: respiratory nitrate reductase subunit gamma [Gammaproteobacteria bacterium]|nr:respiratory nitrate reductase subunit gamma [Gammaproteobacteria bacterium]